MTARGRVWLVGAGPGDPELLTVKALRVIRSATVILVDDLVGDDVLDFALRGRGRRPRIVRVGKRGGCRSTPQEFIERLMLAEALAGERVVRLKGGDPFVFGRGGEEAEHLRAHGIDVEVVHGITAALAAAGALGAPLTHRDHAHGVMLLTGHPRHGAPPTDWAAIGTAAAQGLTLVIYMGVAEWPTLEAGLRQALPADTPAAAVQHASLAQQRRVAATLGSLGGAMARAGIASPAIIVVGDVLAGMTALDQEAGATVGVDTRDAPVRRRDAHAAAA